MDITYYKDKYEPIDGKWYITRELGRGAYGVVFEVERRDFTNAKAAMKVISIPSSASEVRSYQEDNYDLDEQSVTSYFFGFVEEFTKEFELMSQLKGNSHIVSIEDYDVKEHGGEIGWDIFIRMELLTPLNRHFAKNAPKTRDVIRLGIDICKALEVCQKYKIVHRDIKPNNIFVSETGMFKLGDFGVARTLEKTSSGLSKKGTYTYMAPEVYKGEEYGSNVDIYSLGIVMYKLLNNNMEPFRKDRTHSDEENALAKRLRGEEIPKPANADGRLAEIVMKACSYQPKDRYESPLQMRAELENILLDEQEEAMIFPKGEKLDYEASVSETDSEETVGLFGSRTAETDSDKGEETVGVFGEREESEETVGIFGSRNEQEQRARQEAMDYWQKKIEEAGEIAEENKRKEEEEKKAAETKKSSKKQRGKKSPIKILGIVLGSLVGLIVLALVITYIVCEIIEPAMHVKRSKAAPLLDYAEYVAAEDHTYAKVEGYIADFYYSDDLGEVNVIIQKPGEEGSISFDYDSEDYRAYDLELGDKVVAAGQKATSNYMWAEIIEIPAEKVVYSELIDDVTGIIGTPEMDNYDEMVVAVTGTVGELNERFSDVLGRGQILTSVSFRVYTKDGKTVNCSLHNLDRKISALAAFVRTCEQYGYEITIYGTLDYVSYDRVSLSVTGYGYDPKTAPNLE